MCVYCRYRQTVSLGSLAVMCQFCKPPQTLEATKGCSDCRANFCNECFKLYHPWGTPRAQHEHVLPTHSFRPKVSLVIIMVALNYISQQPQHMFLSLAPVTHFHPDLHHNCSFKSFWEVRIYKLGSRNYDLSKCIVYFLLVKYFMYFILIIYIKKASFLLCF